MRRRALDLMPMVFQDGPFRLQMGLRRLAPADWLLVTEHFETEVAEKHRLLAEGADIVARERESDAAVAEGAALIAAFLDDHHPDLPGAPDVADPLLRAGLSVQEDLCWLRPTADGYRLTAAFVAFPSRWRLATKIGRPLPLIHAPVPGLETKIGGPIGRVFETLDVDRPVWRANWALLDDPALHQPTRRHAPAYEKLQVVDAATSLHVRVERQTLRRLPESGCILFTIHTFVAPLGDIARDPERARALAARLDEMPATMRDYKNLHEIGPLARAYLDAVMETRR